MPIAGILTGRVFQPRYLMFAALLGVAWSMYRATGLNLDATFDMISGLRMSQVVCLPFVFIPLSAVQFIGVPPGKNPDASALINLMRNLGAIARELTRQASMLSYIDVFLILAVVSLITAPLALLLPRVAKGAAVGAH